MVLAHATNLWNIASTTELTFMDVSDQPSEGQTFVIDGIIDDRTLSTSPLSLNAPYRYGERN